MWMSDTKQAFYVCRRCRPVVPFYAYDELRAHLRIHHHIRELPNSEICLYEAFQDARFRAPRKLREKRSQTPSVGSQGSDASNTSYPFRMPLRSQPAQSKSSVNPAGVNVGASCSGTKDHQNRNATTQNESESVSDIINARIAAQVNAEITSRLPLLNTEVQNRVQQAVKQQVPECVRDTLLAYVDEYNKYEERTNASGAVVSTQSRLRECLRLSLEQAKVAETTDVEPMAEKTVR